MTKERGETGRRWYGRWFWRALTLLGLGLGICLYGAFQSQADFTSPISFTVMREQLLVARRPTVIG